MTTNPNALPTIPPSINVTGATTGRWTGSAPTPMTPTFPGFPTRVTEAGIVAHLMFDLETASERVNALPLSIGVVAMDKDLNILDSQEWTINWEKERQLVREFDMSPATFVWWLQQNEEARKRLSGSVKGPSLVAGELYAWMLGLAKYDHYENVQVWGNGAGFDIPILENFMRHTLGDTLWKFWNARCFRTMKALYSFIQPPKINTLKHGALSDAMHQAEHLRMMFGNTPQ